MKITSKALETPAIHLIRYDRPLCRAAPELVAAIERLSGPLRKVLSRRCLAEPDIEDACQVVLMHIARNWARLRDLPPRALVAYSVRAGFGVTADMHRQAARRRRLEENLAFETEVSGDDPDRAVAARQVLSRVAPWLGTMSPPDREVLVLAGIHELSRHEIAARLGIAEGTVASRLGRARATARQWL